MTTPRGRTLAPSDDLQPSHIPLFPGWGVFVDACDYAIRYQLAQIDRRGVAGYSSGDTIPVNALKAMMAFVGIGGLDTEVLGEQYRRNIYQANAVLRRFRGTEFVLDEFKRHTGIEFDVTEVRNGAGRLTDVDIFIEPPLGRSPTGDWQRYMRRAFRWLLDPGIRLRNFSTGIIIDDTIYIYSDISFTIEARAG